MGAVEDALTEASARLDDAANSLAELDLSAQKDEVVNFLNSCAATLNACAAALDSLKNSLGGNVEQAPAEPAPAEPVPVEGGEVAADSGSEPPPDDGGEAVPA